MYRLPTERAFCFAIARETVMRYVDLLKKCKLDVVGVHTETMAMVHAFDHLNHRKSEENIVTMWNYINPVFLSGFCNGSFHQFKILCSILIGS